MNAMRQCWISNLLLIVVLVVGFFFGGFGSRNLAADATTLGCSNLDITGSYKCNVACVARDEDTEKLKGFTVSGEIDTIKGFTIEQVNESNEFYKVDIESGSFTETEIGPRVGCTLYTATESVSDKVFPVLEEYIFQEGSGPANGFTKVVRNPSEQHFKTCKVECTR